MEVLELTVNFANFAADKDSKLMDIIKSRQTDELASAVQIIKEAIQQSQLRALGAVNQEQLALYYGIGRFISANTRNKNWGKGFIEAVSEQLRKELPGLRGFSVRNIKNMRTFYEEWQTLENHNSAVATAENESGKRLFVGTNENENLAVKTAEFSTDKIYQLKLTNLPDFPVVAFLSISFTHHTAILTKVKSYEERIFYLYPVCCRYESQS